MSPLEILSRTFKPIEISAKARTGPKLSGLYMLVLADEIIYVGASADLMSRLYDQRSCRSAYQSRRFDFALWMSLPVKVLPFYEGALIRCLRPRDNRMAPQSRRHDLEILDGLGLPVPASSGVNARLWREETDRRRAAWLADLDSDDDAQDDIQ